MTGIAELQNNPDFQKLSPEAKSIAFEKLSSQDAQFANLSDQAKEIVKNKIIGSSAPASSIPVPGTAEPTAPYMVDQFKRGVAALPDLFASGVNLALDAPNYLASGVNKAIDATGLNVPDVLRPGQLPSVPDKLRPGPIDPLLGVKNLPVPKDQYGKPNKSSEYLGAISNFIGAGLVPGIGVVNAAESKLTAALVELAGAAVAGMSSVEGKELGKSLAAKFGADPERGGQIGEFVGSFFGPGAVALAGRQIQKGTQAATKFASEKTGITGVSEEAQANAGRALATDEIKASLEASPFSQQNLKEAADLQKAIPDFNPTLGQATGAPGIVAIEQRLSNQNPQSLARAAGREQENLQALNTFKESNFPVKENFFQPAVKKEVYTKSKLLEKNLEKTQNQIEDLASKYQYQDNASIGEKLRELRNTAASQVKAAATAKYNEVYRAADKAGISEDMTDIGKLVNGIVKDSGNSFQVMPPIFSQILSKYGGKSNPASFEEMHSLYKRANADLADAIISGDSARAYYIGKVKDALSEKISNIAGTDIASEFVKANKFYKEKYAEVFKEGAGGKMARINRYGEVTNDEDIVRKLLFTPNNSKGMENFTAIYGNNPEALQSLKNGILDIFSKEVVRDGEIKPRLVESFMRRYAQALDQVPSMKSGLSTINKVNDQLLERRALIQEQRKLYDNTVISKLAKTEDPEAVISKALTDRKSMLALLSQVKKNPDTAQSLARGIADRVLQEKNPYQYLMENSQVIKPAMQALGENHYANLEKLAQAQGIMSRVKAPTNVELDRLKDIGEKTLGTSVKGVFSNIQNTVRGYQSQGYLIMNLGGRFIYKIKSAEANKLLEEAIYDPKLAQALVEISKRPPTTQALNNLKNHAFSHGIRVISYNSEDQQPTQ